MKKTVVYVLVAIGLLIGIAVCCGNQEPDRPIAGTTMKDIHKATDKAYDKAVEFGKSVRDSFK